MTSRNFPTVVVLDGSLAGTVLSIDEVLTDFSIGSAEGCHLILSGDSVSPIHASIFLDDEGTVTLTDTKSRAGVFVNGEKILEQALANGDEISLGLPDDFAGARLRFSADGADVPLVDLSPEVTPELGGLGDMSSFQVEAPLQLEETPAADVAPEAPGLESPDASVPELEALPSFDAPAPADDFPPMETTTESEPQPEAEVASEPVPLPVVPVAPSAKPASGITSTPTPAAPRRPTSKRIATSQSDDPLDGLAESLGGNTGRQRLQLPTAEAVAPAQAKKRAMPISARAARLLAVTLVLTGAAWFGVRKYADSVVIPVVDTYLPNPAEPGQTITLTGSGYGLDPAPADIKVMVGTTEATVLDASPTRINFTLPESLGASGSQTLELKVTAAGTTSTGRLLKVTVAPKIASLTPRVALTGDEVAIAGKWLANTKTKPVVTVAGVEAEVYEATPAKIRIKVPSVTASEGQRISVKVAVGSDTGKEALLNYGRLPFVETVVPNRASPGDLVTLTGLGLSGPDVAVAVGGRRAAVLSSTDTELKISLPGLRVSDNAGKRDLVVQANQKLSVASPIEVLRESAALYSPRFFVDMRESRAVVACELGAVMVLGSDPTAVKRAHDAAAKLNELAATGRASRVQFVAGNVAISANGSTVINVAPGDGNGNARGLAEVWTASLTDMFDLYLQGRRPARTVEVSPDGKVFLDIYSSARRRSAEPGVPMGVLFSPDPAWVRSLETLATSPSLGSSQAGALVDGYWGGAIEVPGAIQPEKIEVSITQTPSGLVGQRTSRRGGLSSDVSLRNLSYSRRELRFSFVDGGENLNYQGRLDGDVIDGTVTKASGARVGKLTLKLSR